MATRTMNTAPPTKQAFQPPSRAASRRPAQAAITRAAMEAMIMTRKKPVRSPIVSGCPTAGGLAGYLSPGTTTRVRKAAPASNAAVARGERLPIRP